MKIRLLKLKDNNKEAKKWRIDRLRKSWEDNKEIIYYQDLPNILKTIYSKLINRHYNNLLIGHFGIEKTWELIA